MKIIRHHFFMLDFTRSFLKGLRRPVMAYLTTLSLSLMGGASALFFWAESGTNDKIQSLFDALYFTVTIMTGVGLGDIAPMTTAGRVLTMLMMLTGTALFVSFIAVLSALILEIEMRHFQKLPENTEN